VQYNTYLTLKAQEYNTPVYVFGCLFIKLNLGDKTGQFNIFVEPYHQVWFPKHLEEWSSFLPEKQNFMRRARGNRTRDPPNKKKLQNTFTFT
jgi:hypothetical protein